MPDRLAPTTRTTVGGALVLFAVALFGVALHHMVAMPGCTAINYRLTPCASGSSWWIGLFIGTIWLTIGAMAVAGSACLRFSVTAVFLAVTAAAISVEFDASASSGHKLAGLVIGAIAGAIAVAMVLILGRSVVRALRAPAVADALVPPPAGRVSRPPPPAPSSTGGSGDSLEQIARLAQLRDTGALTETEFEREKAKLLGEH